MTRLQVIKPVLIRPFLKQTYEKIDSEQKQKAEWEEYVTFPMMSELTEDTKAW